MSVRGHLEENVWNNLRDLLAEYANQGMGLPSIPIQLPSELKFYIRDSVSYLTKRQIMRPYYLLIFGIRGEQHFQVEDQEIILQPGELFILLPFTRHNFFTSPHFPARALFISFVSQEQDSRLDSICETTLKLRRREVQALRTCALMSGKAFQKDAGYGQECVMAFMLFLFSLIRRFSPDTPACKLEKNALPRKIELMRQIISIVHKKTDAKLSVKTIAQQVHLSEIRVRQIFKEQMKCPIGTYIRGQALTRALFLARSTGLSFSEIAQRVGYTNSGAMATAIRRETGKNLRDIRRENQD